MWKELPCSLSFPKFVHNKKSVNSIRSNQLVFRALMGSGIDFIPTTRSVHAGTTPLPATPTLFPCDKSGTLCATAILSGTSNPCPYRCFMCCRPNPYTCHNYVLRPHRRTNIVFNDYACTFVWTILEPIYNNQYSGIQPMQIRSFNCRACLPAIPATIGYVWVEV